MPPCHSGGKVVRLVLARPLLTTAGRRTRPPGSTLSAGGELEVRRGEYSPRSKRTVLTARALLPPDNVQGHARRTEPDVGQNLRVQVGVLRSQASLAQDAVAGEADDENGGGKCRPRMLLALGGYRLTTRRFGPAYC